MADINIKLKADLAWWWPWYFKGLMLAAAVSGREPDWDKFKAVIRRAVRIRIDCSCPP